MVRFFSEIGNIVLRSSSEYVIPFRTLTSGLIIYTKGIRDERYVIDYSNDGGETWLEAIVDLYPEEDNIIINIDDEPEGYRDSIRDGAYVIDRELTSLGFDGIEDTDWIVDYYLNPIE